jgi:hypothetical protein
VLGLGIIKAVRALFSKGLATLNLLLLLFLLTLVTLASSLTLVTLAPSLTL